MGKYIGCGTCGATVYTTGSRLPHHDRPDGEPCRNWHKAAEPEEYTVGYDDDFWVMGGGLPERDRRKF